MCEHGINVDQMRLMIAHVDESIALSQKWLEQLHHLADHASLSGPSVSMAQATVLLGEARAKLEDAMADAGQDAAGEVTIERF